MITGEQIRAAMGMLRWSRRVLHEKSGIPVKTIQRIAESEGVPNVAAKSLETIENTFTEAGIVFLPSGANIDGREGVRFK